MEEKKEETIKEHKKANYFGAIMGVMGRVSKHFSLRTHPRPNTPWVRIRERKGSRTLVWGMGDGKLFGSVPLDPEVAFSVDPEGVKLRSVDGDPLLIGSPGNESANILLSRKIEKILRNQGRRNMIVWASIGTLIFLVVLEALGGTALGRLAQITPSGSGGGNLSSLSDLPVPSMSSGLTCHTH